MRPLAIALVALAVVPAGARASTLIGQTSGSPQGCSKRTLYWQHAGASAPYAVPAPGGVITSWSTNPGGVTGVLERLIVVREGSPNTLVGASDYEGPLATHALNRFTTRIPVRPGDLIGLESSTGSAPCKFATGVSADKVARAGDPTPALTFNTGTTSPQVAMNVQANVEPDADGDGFGDETQDACPYDPTTQSGCSADLSIATTVDKSQVKLRDTVTFNVEVHNNSPTVPVRGVNLSDVLPRKLGLIAATSPTGSCQVNVAINCALAPLGPGATEQVSISARAIVVGDAFNSATVRSSTPDPDTGNNAAGANTTVLAPPFGGARAGTRRLRLTSRGIALLRVSCPADTVGSCFGGILLKTAHRVVGPGTHGRKRIVDLGIAAFAIRPGATPVLRVPLYRRGIRLVNQKRALRAVIRIRSHDEASQTAISFSHLTIRARNKRPPPHKRLA